MNNCKNVKFGFDVTKAEDGKWLYDVLDAKSCYDLDFSLYEPDMSLELISTLNMAYSGFCSASHYCNNVWYSDKCNNGSDLFGCIGLKKKKYCILNKQYSPEEFAKLRMQIVDYMKHTGEWGEYFPIGTTGFGYNETVAQEYFPLTKEDCEKQGWMWWNKMPFTIGKETIKQNDLPDDIKDAPDLLSKAILACADCGRNYRIIGQELAFYKKLNIPVPRQCVECRHKVRSIIAGVRHLWHRKCMCSAHGHDHVGACTNEFETTYAPERKEIVWCQECYKKEVY